MIPTAQGLLLNQVIMYLIYLSYACSVSFKNIHIVPVLAITNIVQTIFKMLDIFIITAYMHFIHKYLLYASYVYHISYIGFAVNWTCYCTATTRWCSTHTKNASQRPTTNTYCTGDGFIHSIIQLHHVHNHCLLNTVQNYFYVLF